MRGENYLFNMAGVFAVCLRHVGCFLGICHRLMRVMEEKNHQLLIRSSPLFYRKILFYMYKISIQGMENLQEYFTFSTPPRNQVTKITIACF